MRFYFTIITISILLCLKNGISHECKPNIAIVGGGIGGASVSHFLTELFEGNLKIDLFEAHDIGGRLATIKIDNEHYEAGGSIIHPRNRYMQDFVKLLGLEHRATSNEKLGIWNGHEFVFRESSWDIVTLAKLIYRYGTQPFRLKRYITSILNDFEKVYTVQDAGKYFMNITSLLAAMNVEFPQMLHISIRDHLLNKGLSKEFIDELVKAGLVVNYGQDTDIHSFVGAVGLAGVGSDLWSIKGGNKQVPEHLIYRNKHINLIPATVRKIRLNKNNSNAELYEVDYNNKDSADIATSRYDIVIIAAPETRDQDDRITFENFPENMEFPGEYHTTIVTFVKGDLNIEYFDLDEKLDGILSCNPSLTKISSIGRLNSVQGSTSTESKVWKIFSNEPLAMNILSEMFFFVEKVKEIPWKAYPKYLTNSRFDKFKLHRGLYHVNAVEWIASAMEMSAIAGRNVAILAHSDFLQRCSSPLNKTATPIVDDKTDSIMHRAINGEL